MLYKDWLDQWLELYVRVSAKLQTYKKYRRQTERYILPALGNCELINLSALRLQRFSAHLTERGLAANTVNGIISILRCSLSKAVAVGLTNGQYANAIVRPRPREKLVLCFSKEEQRKIERYVLSKHKYRLFGVVLCLYTGLRIGELLALTWDDIDMERGTISVTKSCHDSWGNSGYVKVIDTPKTCRSERVIPLPKQIVAYLRKMRLQSTSAYVVEGRCDCGAEVRSYQRTFEKILNKIGVAHKGFHSLRHTFATRALESGMDVKTLSEILGHSNAAVTLQRYAHSLLEHKVAMMDRLGQLFDDNEKSDG